MKAMLLTIGLATAACAAARTPGFEEIVAALSQSGCRSVSVEYTIVPPNTPDDVTYRLELSQSAATDTLAPCAYLIEWSLVEPEQLAGSGFSAYFDGNHYRYRPGKLQEYHAADDPTPFAPGGDVAAGVQMQAQFANLLPAMMAGRLKSLAADQGSSVTITRRGDDIAMHVVETHDGYEVLSATYCFDGKTLMPKSIESVYNQGQTAEQSVTASYGHWSDACPPVTENDLIARHHDEFGKYRRDSYSLLSLPGGPFPSANAPTLGGERWSHRAGEPFGRPTVVAVLDDKVDSTPEVVGALRQAVDMMPFAADLVLAFTGNDREGIEAVTGAARHGEWLLFNARSLARDCGVADTPSIIFCSPDGQVADVHIGRNNDLRSIVIQKASMAAKNR